MAKKSVFISFSGEMSRAAGTVLKSHLDDLFKNKVQIFHYELSASSGLFNKNIKNEIKKAKAFVPILTEKNSNAPWLMFEAGMAYMSLKEKQILPLHFMMEGTAVVNYPLIALHSYNYQIEVNSGKSLKDLFNQLIELIFNKEKKRKKYRQQMESIVDLCGRKLLEVAEKGKKGELDGLKTVEQAIIPIFYLQDLYPLKQNKTPEYLLTSLRNFVVQYVNSSWCQASPLQTADASHGETIVQVNQTRFATFVVFTDGTRVLFFNRRRPSNSSILNPRLDVFGAMDFENSSIAKKFSQSRKFFETAPVIDVKPLYGAAVEYITGTDEVIITNKESTAVMFGLAVYVKESDLDQAVEKNINNNEDGVLSLYALEDAAGFVNLTAKARLAVEHLLWSSAQQQDTSDKAAEKSKKGVR